MALFHSAVVLLFFINSIFSQAPCDIFASGNTPCVAAHSITRALFSSFNGALYQVRRARDNTTRDIYVVSAGSYANATAQDQFCEGTTCTIEIIYDQTSRRNHLPTGPGGGAAHNPDKPVNAARNPITIAGGHKVYSAYFEGGMGYRNDQTNGIATGNNPETLYMVTAGNHVNGGCCFDYGNAETNNNDDGAGTMEAVYFGTCNVWGRGSGNGPWVMADLENGLWAGNEKVNDNNTPLTSNFVFAMVKGNTDGFTLKGGDANGPNNSLKTMYNGARPSGYQPMKKQGAIILGIGGDNSNGAIGTFFEGVMTTGISTDAIDNAVFNNVVSARYGA